MYSRIDRYENDLKVCKNQIKSLKSANSEYENKKTQEIALLMKESERVKNRDRENQNRLVYLIRY